MITNWTPMLIIIGIAVVMIFLMILAVRLQEKQEIN